MAEVITNTSRALINPPAQSGQDLQLALIRQFHMQSGASDNAIKSEVAPTWSGNPPDLAPTGRSRLEIREILEAEGVTFIPNRPLRLLILPYIFSLLRGVNIMYGERWQVLATVRVEELLNYVYLFEAMVDPFTNHAKRRRWRDHLIEDFGQEVCDHYDRENKLRGVRQTVAVGSIMLLRNFSQKNGQVDDALWLNAVAHPLSETLAHGGFSYFRDGSRLRKRPHPGYERMRSIPRKIQLTQLVEDRSVDVLDYIRGRAST